MNGVVSNEEQDKLHTEGPLYWVEFHHGGVEFSYSTNRLVDPMEFHQMFLALLNDAIIVSKVGLILPKETDAKSTT